jgi:hypothetical protein
MTAGISVTRTDVRRASAIPLRRVGFLALLLSLPLLPHLESDPFGYPAVANGWICLPLCALIVLAVVDGRPASAWLQIDLVALLSLTITLACWRAWRTWPTVLLYVLLGYLAARMLVIAEIGRSESKRRTGALRPALPRTWLLAGIVVLAGLHLTWTLQATQRSDVGSAGIHGALALIHGRPVYGAPLGKAASDPHLDTYGPANYEAYVPFVGIAGGYQAARLTSVFFDLLAALLLFLLGRRLRSSAIGTLLAFCWLAFPLTFYNDVLAFNDSIVAAALAGTLLAARAPVRRGLMAALAAWTKLSPLALVPLLAAHGVPRDGHRTASSPSSPAADVRRRLLPFGAGLLAASVLVFIPVFAHNSAATFFGRTFGFQAGRSPDSSLWAVLPNHYALSAPWITDLTRVAHGLLAVATGTLVLLLAWIRRRGDVVGLAAASAAVMIALVACASYLSLSYVLWFAPLVLAALLLDGTVEA